MTRFYQNGQPDAQPARVARFALYEVTSERLKSVKAHPQVLGRSTAPPCRRPNLGRKGHEDNEKDNAKRGYMAHITLGTSNGLSRGGVNQSRGHYPSRVYGRV